MKTYIIIYSFILMTSLFCSRVYSQNTDHPITQKEINNTGNNVIGQYRANNGFLLFINKNNSFYIIKGSKHGSDVINAGCDTLSKGVWSKFSSSIIKLSNDPSYNSVEVQVSDGNKRSLDSVYLNINLPKNDTFFEGRFKYQVSILGKLDVLESLNSLIAIPKSKIYDVGNLYYHLALTIQDLYPRNCKANGYCYQRIYFNILDNYNLDTKSNYFTITLKNFNDCYVQYADVDNDLLVAAKNTMYWRGTLFTIVE